MRRILKRILLSILILLAVSVPVSAETVSMNPVYPPMANTTESNKKAPEIHAQAHIQDIGWLNPVEGSKVLIGTTGQSKRMEGFVAGTTSMDLDIVSQVHVEDYGWMPRVETGRLAGTTGEAKRVECFRLWLEGPEAVNYDLWYRTHVENYGWLGWTSNGASAGTTQHAFRCEAIEMTILPKGSPAPGSTVTPVIEAFTREEGINMFHVNTLRKDNGLGFVTGDEGLHKCAEARAKELAVKYDHVRPNGTNYRTIVKEIFPNFKYDEAPVLENICGGISPVGTFITWSNSPGHRRSMLDSYANRMAYASDGTNAYGHSVQWFEVSTPDLQYK